MKKTILTSLLVLLVGLLLPQMAFAIRIVSLANSLTKNVQYLGAEGDLVGKTSFCTTKRDVAVVATAIKVNVEKVIALKPDLVLASSLTPPETLASLKKMGLNVKLFPMATSYVEVCSQFRELGKLLGRTKQANRVLAQTDAKVKRLKPKMPSRKRVFVELGAEPLYAVIGGTFMNDYITFAGATNIAGDLKSANITREAVLTRNPEAIFIVTMGETAENEKKTWEKYSSLAAVKNKKILLIDADKACTPTPVTFAETLEIIAKALNF